jgi:hypothetical protein
MTQAGPGVVVAINVLAGIYSMTARLLRTLGVDLETPFVGWFLEGPATQAN